jgi:outer membrane protein OmpA-like peptidoglycan-associated protein
VAAWRLFIGGGFGRIQSGIAPIVVTCPDGQVPVEGRTLEDGCYTPLTVLATLDGRPHPAEVSILGPGGTARDTIGPAGMILRSLPGDQWSGVATAGACLTGEADLTTTNLPDRLEIPLKSLRDASLVLKVVDPQGNPVSGAVGQWSGPDPSCFPGPVTAGGDGSIAQQIGAGTYGLRVQAGGYQPFESTVQVARAETREITVVLQPARVEVTKEKIVILDKIFFEFEKAVIKAESYTLLNEVARIIIDNPQVGRVEVAGHTDNRGSDAYNMQLSQSRAESVAEYLASKGVDRARIIGKGYGETRPLSTNKTSSGRDQNRRVEFILIDSDGGDQ